MSLFDNLKEQFKILGNKIGQQIQESPSYAQAQDRYENMSPSMQKLSISLTVLVIVFIILFFPVSHLSESYTALSLFEEKRNLIRDLFHTYRESSAAPDIAAPPSYEGLRSSVQSIIAREELLPEQQLGISDGPFEGRLIPQALVSNILLVKLAKLNLKQIVDIGSAITAISESVKMKDLLISANRQDTRYYDVTYKLYSLKVPEPNIEPSPEPEKNIKKSRGSDQ